VAVCGGGGERGAVDGCAKVYVGGHLYLGCDGTGRPAADIRRCRQFTLSSHVPYGYTGKKNQHGHAVLGGSTEFHADDIVILHVGQ